MARRSRSPSRSRSRASRRPARLSRRSLLSTTLSTGARKPRKRVRLDVRPVSRDVSGRRGLTPSPRARVTRKLVPHFKALDLRRVFCKNRPRRSRGSGGSRRFALWCKKK